MSLENFKCFQDKEIKFDGDTKVSGRNQEGKTTIMDAYFDILTGKLSDGTMPDGVRRKEDGKEVDKVDVIRQIRVSINGKEYDLKKITKQKKKSSQAMKQLMRLTKYLRRRKSLMSLSQITLILRCYLFVVIQLYF